jgi:hypothetical protein
MKKEQESRVLRRKIRELWDRADAAVRAGRQVSRPEL